ncbi:MAG: nucleoside deaminase [Jaaginema sp. PMC 1079.18]|nr:nucleoside deaminase [Jaaginema sp. PMC 1080.18]MEC4851174.1 nucleoside deaminase [Jaaginema sp. PMC 1079.18]MEC4866123.1 nucleoside deaminase [Jaaginema sp. PMC 1078.18]
MNFLALDERAIASHRVWMQRAIAIAQTAGEAGDVPVGAVIVDARNTLIAEAANRKERDRDPTAHAEILALRSASQNLNTWHLNTCTLYVTLEPCPMCAGAILHARLGLLVYGADDPKTGVIRTMDNFGDRAFSNHRLPVLAGICEADCRHLLQTWFQQYR